MPDHNAEPNPADRSGEFPRWLLVCGYIVLLAIALLPIWLTDTLPPSDYSAHLARMRILVSLPDSPALQQFYQIHWSVVPNLAMDIVVPLLAKLMPLETAGRVYFSLIFLLTSSGMIALHYAVHRRLSAWPLIVFLFLYNWMLILGLMSYLFALGLAIWGMAAWVHLRERAARFRMPLFYAFSVMLFIAHLAAFGFYAMVVVCYEAQRFFDRPPSRKGNWGMQWLLTLGQFVVPAGLLLASRTASLASLTSHWQPIRKALAPASLVWNYNQTLDLVTIIVLAQIVIIGFISRRLVLARSLKLAVAVAVLVFLAMPSTILSSDYADYRIIPATAFLFIAGTDLRVARKDLGVLLLVGLTGLFAVRMAVVVNHWRELDRRYAVYLQAIDKLPVGSRLFAAFAYADAATSLWNRDLNEESVPPYALIRKSALVPFIYADANTTPVSFTQPYRALAEATSKSLYYGGDSPDWAMIEKHFDYWLIARESLFKTPLPGGLDVVFEGPDFRLYRVRGASR